MTQQMRHLAWEACYNTRDLGGLPIVDGRETRWQSIIRSDILNRLTQRGQQALWNYGVRTVIDLRGAHEVAAEPSTFTASEDNEQTPVYLNLPLEKYDPQVSALISQADTRAEVYCLILDHYPDRVAEILRVVAHARPRGVLIHCHAGKDRTGIITALLLSLAGVPAEIIAADYAESQQCLWPLYEQMVAEAGGEENLEFWLKPTAVPEMMLQTLAHLDTTYGGVKPYLFQAGLTSTELEDLRQRLQP